PYVAQRCAKLCLPDVISGLDSLDLYRRLHHTKLLFGIENTKQKTFERFTGLFRVDQFNGGELIDVYHDYQKTQSEESLRMILLHNREDVLGMT
ncbi:MAG: ribonuclease H-like domain-containing protein, partial [Lachnospiraceae bacterium]|nr:ribonuclease H-like domain-containing protein [Candidatus Minthocola equi]